MKIFLVRFLLFFCCFFVPPLFWVFWGDVFERWFVFFRNWLKNEVVEGSAEEFISSLNDSVSRFSVVSFVLFFSGFLIFLIYLYYKSTDVFESFFLLPFIFIVSNILAIFVLYKIRFFSSFFNSGIFSILKWVSLLVVVWVSQAIVSKQISNVFNFDQVHFPIALSGGVFLYSMGVLSVFSIFLMFFFEFVLCFCFMVKRRVLIFLVCSLVFFGLNLSSLVGSILTGAFGEFIVVQIAYVYDLLDYKVCVNDSSKKDYRILYLDGDKNQAMVFSNPVEKLSNDQKLIPLRTLSYEDIQSRIPVYEGVVNCEYRVFNVD